MQDTTTELFNGTDTANGGGSIVDTKPGQSQYDRGSPARFFLDISAATGTTPTLDVDIVATVDGDDHVLASFTQANSVSRQNIVIEGCPAEVKAVYAIGGTGPSFTFKVNCVRQ